MIDDLTKALFRFFGPGSGICLPPVPEDCRDRLMLLPPATFTTVAVDQKELYLFSRAAREFVAAAATEQAEVTASLFGHGINSYAWTLRLQRPGLRVLMQVAYGGAFMDREKQAREVTAMFQQVHRLHEDTPVGADGPDHVVLSSSLRRQYAEGPLPRTGVDALDWLDQHTQRRRPTSTGTPPTAPRAELGQA